MEMYNSSPQWHKNVLKKEEEIFLLFFLFFLASTFTVIGFSIDGDKNYQLQTVATSYRQFSIVARAYAAQNQ